MSQLFVWTLCASKHLTIRCCTRNFTLYFHLYSQISRVQYVWRHRYVIGKENDQNTDYRYSCKVQYRPIPITDLIIGATLELQLNWSFLCENTYSTPVVKFTQLSLHPLSLWLTTAHSDQVASVCVSRRTVHVESSYNCKSLSNWHWALVLHHGLSSTYVYMNPVKIHHLFRSSVTCSWNR